MLLNAPGDLAHIPFDPLAPAVLADPYPFYAWLRSHDPVHWGHGGESERVPTGHGCWYITRHADAVALLKDDRFGREIDRVLPERNPLPPDPTAAAIVHEWMTLRDPPDHTHLRALVQRAFTPQMIERWEPRIAAVMDSLVAQARAQGEFDLIHDIAAPLPVVIVAEMLGVPPADAPRFTPWTRALAALIEFEQTPEIQAHGAAAMAELADYLRTIIAARRVAPQDDLISALLTPPDGDPPTEDELLGSCTQLLFGGNDPMAHLIGNAIWTLLHHPDQRAWLAAQPSVPLSAVDELMRYDSSVQMTFRYALSNVTWGGKTIKTGDLVAIVFGAANRDAAAFDRPDMLDLRRAPNRHLSLGQGIHYCMGASLARTEGRIVLGALTQAFPRLRLLDPQPAWQRTVAVRGLQRLPVAVA
jgi:hypothetical protein